MQGVQGIDMVEKGGEISPPVQKAVKLPNTKVMNNEYIVELADNLKKSGEILPTIARKGSDTLYEEQAWFQNTIKCVSKWSKALKKGGMYSVGLDNKHTAPMDS